ncbi:MAG: hypothetical protein ACKV0T_19060, partial [Planctomycetales bacterium]
LQRQVERLHTLGVIDRLSLERLHDALQTEVDRARVLEQPAEPVRPASRVSPSPEVLPSSIFETEASQTGLSPVAREAPRGAQTAATVSPAPAAPATPQPQPRSWSEVLDGFMEERNLRWGELIGGLLIVCGSIALVINFWKQIDSHTLLKFFVFNGFSAAMFGLAAYADRRLRLPTTGRSLFSIATLLVPLNFLALAAFTQDRDVGSVLTILGEVVSVGMFAGLTWFAGRTTTPQAAPLLALGVVGSSVVSLLVRAFIDANPSVVAVYALGLLPLAFLISAVAGGLKKFGTAAEPDDGEVYSHFRLLGSATFATLFPLGLLVDRSKDVPGTLRLLSVALCLLAAPALATGLSLWKRITTPTRSGLRTTGSAVAIAGALIMLVSIPLAWPHPGVMLLVALVNFSVLTAIALAQSLPAGHLLALPCLGLAYLLGVHLVRGELSWELTAASSLTQTLVSAASGAALVPLSLLLGGAAVWFRGRRPEESRFIGLVTLLSVAVSLILAACFGLGRTGDPGGATWVFGFYAVGLLAYSVQANRNSAAVPAKLPGIPGHPADLAAWCGGGLLLVACIQGTVIHFGEPLDWQHPWLLAFLTHATALAAIVWGTDWLPGRSSDGASSAGRRSSVVRILVRCATTTSLLAAGYLTWQVPQLEPSTIAWHAAWLSVVWCVLSWNQRSQRLFTLFQAGCSATVVFAVAAGIRAQSWGTGPRHVWLDPWSWQLQGGALALLGLAWTGLRMGLRRASLAAATPIPAALSATGIEAPAASETATTADSPKRWVGDLQNLMTPPWPSVDRIVGWVVLGMLVVSATYGAIPGVAQELSPRSLAVALETAAGASVPLTERVVPAPGHFEVGGIPHVHALDWGAWILLILVVLLMATWQLEDFRVRRAGALLIALAAACPLLAGRWEADVACASALRWTSALFLVMSSAAIWARQPLLARLQSWLPRSLTEGFPAAPAAGGLTALALGLAAAPLVAMGLFVGAAAVWHNPPQETVRSTLIGASVLVIFALPIGLALRILSSRWLARLPLETQLASEHASARGRQRAAGGLRHAGILIWILGIGPMLAVGLFIVSSALRGNPVVGPEPGSLFHRLGLAVSYATPVALCGLTLVGYAVRERSSAFAFAAGLLFNVCATAADLLRPHTGGLTLDATLWVHLTQLNTVVSAGYGLLWMAAAKYRDHADRREQALEASESGGMFLRPAGMPIPGLLVTQSLIGAALTAVLLIPAFLGLVIQRSPVSWMVLLADPLGRTAWFMTLTGLAVLGWMARTRPTAGPVSAALWSLALMVTSYACHWDQQNQVAFHTLLAARAAAGWLLLVGFAAIQPRIGPEEQALRRNVTLWTALLGIVTVLLALRDVLGSERAWPGVGAIVSVSLLFAALACWTKRRGAMYAMGGLASLAHALWWYFGPATPPDLARDWPILIDVIIAAWLVPAIVSLLLERWGIEPAETASGLSKMDIGSVTVPGWHRFAAAASVAGLAIAAGLGLLSDAAEASLACDPMHRWMALGCAGWMVAMCLWDRESAHPVLGIYLWGLSAVAVILDRYDLAPRMIPWNGTLALTGYAIATGLLWLGRSRLQGLARAGRIPDKVELAQTVYGWLVPATTLLTAIVLVLAIAIDLQFAERNLRLIAATAALVVPVSMGLLVRQGNGVSLPASALSGGVIGAVAWSWGWLDPSDVSLLHRFVVLTAALAAMTVLYGMLGSKLLPEKNDWSRAATRLTPRMCLCTLAAVVLVLGDETTEYFTRGAASMSAGAIAVMAATILGLFMASLTAALVPGRDPWNLSERGRMVYVYVAEALLAALFLHIRLTIPRLFHGFLTQYWPFIVMLLAFVGVGLSELFRRQRRLVLAEPLERTGALLPILPVIGFWAVPSGTHLSLVLLMAGGVYSALSLLRRSFTFGLLGALAANGGLWYFLHNQHGYGFLAHPQVWLIPFAICVLGAAYLNREQLSEEQMAVVRYLASVTIYVSSTAEMFLQGVANAPWLAVVLAGLSVGGMLMGMLLRVRAFLFMGTGFLVLSLATLIYHAAFNLDQMWLIWLTVVLAGVLVLAVFALFE